jgi:amino acid adenylation domain-containing protein
VLFGDVVAGRPAEIEGIETMMGMFINALPVRVRVEDGEPLLSWLQRLQEQQLEARQYEYSPLVQVQQWSDVPAGTALFETLLSYQNYPVDASLRAGRGSVRIEEASTIQTAHNPLTVTFTPGPRLIALIKYDCSRFAAETIDRMLGHLRTLLEAMAAHPARRLAEYEMLSEAEQQQLLFQWNETKTAYPRELQLQQLFEQQVERTPEAVALVFEEHSLTYRQLNERSNQLAHYLQSCGIGSEILVGLCVERSLELIIAVLGILKAGGVYVPLDPEYPLAHLSFMLEDAAPPVLLTTAELADKLPPTLAQIICLDTDLRIISAQSTENPESELTPDKLAYVMYTSGSTGRHKGVSVTHGNVVRLVTQTDYATFNADEVFLQLSPLSFDASTLEIWGPLLNGGQLVLMSAGMPTLQELGETITRHRVTTLWLTAGLFHLMVDERAEDLKSVRQLLAGGDVLSVPHVRRAAKALSAGHVINGYGPTEGTTFTCCYRVRTGEPLGVSVPIGRPVANTQVYVLDAQLRPVPVGVPGELYLGGAGLARGYLHQSGLTAERFIPHPYSAEGGARLYRTGDRVRYRADGDMEFLGRVDRQVKVRGHRIELGEVEAALAQHHGVRECAVMVRDEGGDKRLVAYIVRPQGQPEETCADLRQYLGEKLPEYMQPSWWVFLEALPLTPNGKVDRRALPDPSAVHHSDVPNLSPCTPVQELMVNIWADVLKVEMLGVEDNFFDLGGHSLLAMQVVSRIREIFGVEVALRELFERRTIAALAQEVTALSEARVCAAQADTPVTRADRKAGEGVALSFAQQRLWFLDQLNTGSSFYNIPVVLRLIGKLDADALELSLNDVIARHESLRTKFESVGGQPVQLIESPATLSLPLIDVSSLTTPQREARVALLRDDEVRTGFNLSEGPLLRVKLLKLAEDEHLLLLTIHHIIADGWSISILARELAALYQAHRVGSEAELADLPVQYADYAVWQRQHLRGEVLEKQLNYWKQQLSGAPAVLKLPSDRTRPPIQSFRGAALSFHCDAELSAQLKSLSRRQSVTLYMTLLAAFEVLLSWHSGETEMVIGTPIANRNRMELESIIGFFVNTLAMRANVGGNPSFTELLARVREVVLGAYANQDVPFERLVEELKPERDLSRSPVFQVMFAWQNAPTEELSLEGLAMSYESARAETAKYDLGLTLWESRESGEIEGVIDYSTDMFNEERIEWMRKHFLTLLKDIVAKPEARISTLTSLPEAERQQQFDVWNNTHSKYPYESCLHELFEAQAEAAPDACAVICDGQSLSYRELNERVNQLAHYLVSRGVKAESIVGLHVEPSIEMIVGLLGILKAGGAYLPLDQTHPAERLNCLLEDACASMLLTVERFAGKFSRARRPVVCLDTDWPVIERESRANPRREVCADNLAYVIYTSGSAGRPKGVLVEHRSVVNHNIDFASRYDLQVGDRVLQFASISFDVAAEEIFPTLLSGATCVLWPGRPEASFDDFLKLLEAEKLSVLNLPTSYWHEWVLYLSASSARLPATLRLVIIGSAQASPERFAVWRKIAGEGIRCCHLYGLTETTITSTTYECSQHREEELYSMPIGRPIANVQVYLLNSYLAPVPIGTPGELYLGGDCLARGYLHNSDLTAQRFIPHPFSNAPGARLYRTGDLAHYLPDGQMCFIGRSDGQLKVRGFRVEPGEIEAKLSSHPAVGECVVVASEGQGANELLAAYVVCVRGRAISPDELREYLKEHLPRYMIPTHFVLLEALPKLTSGKVDRRALPSPPIQNRLTQEVVRVAHRSELGKKIATIWQDVLSCEGFGADDNFFDVGGNSLLALIVHARLRAEVSKDLTLVHLFEYPTIASLVAYINREQIETRAVLPIRARIQKQKEAINRQKQKIRKGRK